MMSITALKRHALPMRACKELGVNWKCNSSESEDISMKKKMVMMVCSTDRTGESDSDRASAVKIV